MDEIAREVATRYLQQIEQLGTEKPELLDAVLHGTEIVIILVDGRKLRFETTDPDAPRAKEKAEEIGSVGGSEYVAASPEGEPAPLAPRAPEPFTQREVLEIKSTRKAKTKK